MLTRETIREKVLNIPYRQSATICDALVEYRHDRTYTIVFPNGNDLVRQTIKEATGALFASQKAPDTIEPTNVEPAKA